MNKTLSSKSKFLSKLLRHKPELLNIIIDNKGWTNLDELLLKINNHGTSLTIGEIEEMINTSDKQRYVIDYSNRRIKAIHGHTIPIDIDIIPTIPPPILYHGTSIAKLPFIEVEGIKRMQRNHVHLSSDINVATSVGKRHGTPIVLSIDTKRMYEDSYLFYLTVNNVWLTDHIPFNYINKQ